MVSKTRKVTFYKLVLEQKNDSNDKKTSTCRVLTPHECEQAFMNIYEHSSQKLENGHHALKLMANSVTCVLEVVSFENHRAFIQIGQQNPSNAVALRDKNTLEATDVPMTATQRLELYTYCLIDFETGIVSYICINGAPRITAIRELFNKHLLPTAKIFANLCAILTDDMVPLLIRKQIISKVSISIAIPADRILSDIGMSEREFDSIYEHNIKAQNMTYVLSAVRNRPLFSSGEGFASFISRIKGKHGANLKSLSVSARNMDEKSQAYNLLEHCFTQTVSLGVEDDELLEYDDFKEALQRTYEENKTILLQYCRA